jgi:hypothetical protein
MCAGSANYHAAAGERGEMPVALDEFQDRSVVGIAVHDMAAGRVRRYYDDRNAGAVAKEIERLDEPAVIISATFIKGN